MTTSKRGNVYSQSEMAFYRCIWYWKYATVNKQGTISYWHGTLHSSWQNVSLIIYYADAGKSCIKYRKCFWPQYFIFKNIGILNCRQKKKHFQLIPLRYPLWSLTTNANPFTCFPLMSMFIFYYSTRIKEN